jgi:hypothetical protein
MQIGFFAPLGRAFERMKHILWRPFDLATWLVLGFSAWLAGLADGAGGGGWKLLSNDEDLPFAGSGLPELWQDVVPSMVLLPAVILIVMAVATIIVLLLWLSSRAKLIFLDNVVQSRAAIVEPWHRLRDLGNSLFLWRLGFVVACGLVVLVLLVLFFAPAASLSLSDALEALSYAAMAVGVMVLVVFGVFAGYVALFLEAFVIPIMYKYELKATEAWGAFLPWLKARPLPFLLYGLLVFALGLGFVLLFAVACVLTCCILALPYVGTVILLPVWVTYRLFSVEFLAQFDPGLDLFAPVQPAQG